MAGLAAAGAVRRLADLGRGRRGVGGRAVLRAGLRDDYDDVLHGPQAGDGGGSVPPAVLEGSRAVAAVLLPALCGMDGVWGPFGALGEYLAGQCGPGGFDWPGDGHRGVFGLRVGISAGGGDVRDAGRAADAGHRVPALHGPGGRWRISGTRGEEAAARISGCGVGRVADASERS